MNDTTAIARATEHSGLEHSEQLAPIGETSIEVFEAQIAKQEQMRTILRDYAKRNLKEGYHYSSKLGTQELAKPMLLQDGTRNICSLFKLFFGEPQITEKFLDGDHYRVLTHINLHNAEGRVIATGVGICSTRETKYAYRTGQRLCPSCGVAAIYKDNKGTTGGWYCWVKKDGCGAKFPANDPAIVEQKSGRVDNPDKADVENTVLKMSVKRAKSAAVCDVPIVSEIFAPEGDETPGKEAGARVRNDPPSRPMSKDPERSDAVEACVTLSGKLQKEHGVKFDDLATQFLPEGVGKFSELTEDQAATVVPGLQALLVSKVTGK